MDTLMVLPTFPKRDSLMKKLGALRTDRCRSGFMYACRQVDAAVAAGCEIPVEARETYDKGRELILQASQCRADGYVKQIGYWRGYVASRMRQTNFAEGRFPMPVSYMLAVFTPERVWDGRLTGHQYRAIRQFAGAVNPMEEAPKRAY